MPKLIPIYTTMSRIMARKPCPDGLAELKARTGIVRGRVYLADALRAGVSLSYVTWGFRTLTKSQTKYAMKMVRAFCHEIAGEVEYMYIGEDPAPREALTAVRSYLSGDITKETMYAAGLRALKAVTVVPKVISEQYVSSHAARCMAYTALEPAYANDANNIFWNAYPEYLWALGRHADLQAYRECSGTDAQRAAARVEAYCDAREAARAATIDRFAQYLAGEVNFWEFPNATA